MWWRAPAGPAPTLNSATVGTQIGGLARLGHALEARVIAAGVETAARQQALAALGIGLLQGRALGAQIVVEPRPPKNAGRRPAGGAS